MEGLKRNRQSIKASITRIQSAFSQDISFNEMKVRVEKLEKLVEEFENIQGKIDTLTEEKLLDGEDRYRADIEEKYYAIKAVFVARQLDEENEKTVLENPNNDSELNSAMKALVEHQSKLSELVERLSVIDRVEPKVVIDTAEHVQHEIRLPQIQIPEFDGNYINWIRFRDLFEALVHNKANLANIEKLEYLQTKLIGDALSLIKHLKPTNENYMVAWELLKKRYERTDKIVNSYLEILFNQAAMKNSSVSEFKRVFNTITECVNALKGLNEPVSQWDSILLFVLEKKLDSESASLWFRTKKPDQTTYFSDFIQFMEARLFELESAHDTTKPKQSSTQQGKNQSNIFATNQTSCPVCEESHFLFHCDKFKALDVGERIKVVKTNRLCFNCLHGNHLVAECKSSACRICKSRHNSLLHIPTSPEGQSKNSEQNSVDNNQAVSPTESSVQVHAIRQHKHSVTILPTALIMVCDDSKKLHPCRALLDSGAEATLVTEACAQRLQLKRKYDKTVLHGVSSSNGINTKGKVKLEFNANGNIIITEAFCLTKLTQHIPREKICSEKLHFFENLDLADPEFNRPQQVDIILGADIVFQLLQSEQIVHPDGSVRAIRTTLGWVIVGKVDDSNRRSIVVAHTTVDLSNQIEKFWIIEDIKDQIDPRTPEEEQAEQHYQSNVERHMNGRYIVRLPFKGDNFEIGDSRTEALKRLNGMENKFKNHPKLEDEYKTFIHEYINLDHMEIENNVASQPSYFMPHHAVLKPSSTTTKLRVVFDASCKSSNGSSLNDHLLVGPTVQKDLFDILIQFRKYKVGFSADIEKMYRQILVHVDDQSFQKILWRDNSAETPKTYKLKTVTYGTSCAPFLATRTLVQVAVDNRQKYPDACNLITDCFYVDDLMSCAPNLEAAYNLTQECANVLENSGFHLRKWSSNISALVNQLDPQNNEFTPKLISDDTKTVKTLGLLWDTKSDLFGFTVSLNELQNNVTKRAVLSDICKIFDPLGWLSPVIIAMKIFMQTLWLKGITWDEPLLEDLLCQWRKLRNNIKIIDQLQIPRWLGLHTDANAILCGFSDASELAYSAVIYLKVHHANGTTSTNIVAAKTRVAPVKQITLPRLELCAAQLLTKLMTKVQKALNLEKSSKLAFTDSTIVLAWLSDHPRRWKTFIANRTSYIINLLPACHWNHIPSDQNPADLATRGISASELMNNELWWHGPNILQTHHEFIKQSLTIPENIDLEERKQIITHVVSMQESDFINKFSDLKKLIRLTAYLLRFAKNCKLEKKNRLTHFLSTDELKEAHDTLVKKVQYQSFSFEINELSKGKQLSRLNKLSALAPFIDSNGLLRVGGRIENADIPYEQKHPLIMDNKSHFCELLVRDCHLSNLHAGNRQLQYILGLKYWIPSIQLILKRCIYKCTRCMRFRNKPFQQQMGNLPACRLQIAPAFTNTGVDFAGPVQVKSWKGRGSRRYKCWIAVFVCLTTKAIHLDLVSELSTAAFIAALRRFVARRGKPCNIYSDNGTNFVGCSHQLRAMREFLSSKVNQENIGKEASQQQINWHFSPPSAPHFGGMFEAAVKSMKYHLKRVLQESSLTFEELYTTLCQIEACLNSRPLCLKFEGDIDPLTPAHFLISRAMNSITDENVLEFKINRLTRWQYLQRLVQQFWKKWSSQFITQLQQRTKWKHQSKNLRVDDIVLLKEENIPPTCWNIGRVVEVHPGADGLVRVASVKTSKGIFKRPIVKLCPLYLDS